MSCKYCHEDRDGFVMPIEKNGHAFIFFGTGGYSLAMKACGWHKDILINFCPMCGRKLREPKEET